MNLMSKKNILFIVEGDVTEKNFINNFFNICGNGIEYDVYSYSTNIHILSQELIVEDKVDDSLDIRLVLREKETDLRKREILSRNYSDIFLVFDFDPHHSRPQFEKIKMLLMYFTDSTLMGKMYINYPMMESYKHFKSLPCNEFANEKISVKNCKKYKEIVGNESAFANIREYDYKLLMSFAVHHIKKSNFVRTKKYDLPTLDAFEKWTEIEIYDKQLNQIKRENTLYIVNEFITYLAYRNPKVFFHQVITHKDSFDI